jgi:hypothetical protein
MAARLQPVGPWHAHHATAVLAAAAAIGASSAAALALATHAALADDADRPDQPPHFALPAATSPSAATASEATTTHATVRTATASPSARIRVPSGGAAISWLAHSCGPRRRARGSRRRPRGQALRIGLHRACGAASESASAMARRGGRSARHIHRSPDGPTAAATATATATAPTQTTATNIVEISPVVEQTRARVARETRLTMAALRREADAAESVACLLAAAILLGVIVSTSSGSFFQASVFSIARRCGHCTTA